MTKVSITSVTHLTSGQKFTVHITEYSNIVCGRSRRFSWRFLTQDEFCVHQFKPERKRNPECKHPSSPVLKKADIFSSAVFGMENDFIYPKGHTINGVYYDNLPRQLNVMLKKEPWKLKIWNYFIRTLFQLTCRLFQWLPFLIWLWTASSLFLCFFKRGRLTIISFPHEKSLSWEPVSQWLWNNIWWYWYFWKCKS